MRPWLLLVILGLCPLVGAAATIGTPFPIAGGITDLVLDEARGRLYLVDTTQNRIHMYSTAQKRVLNTIPVGAQPLSAALSRDGRFLYVTAYQAATLEVVDLESGVVVQRVSLPAAPEGVAVGGDERVLITTVGSGTGNAENRLLLYHPNLTGEAALRAVPVTLPAPASPQVPAPASRVYMSTRSSLAASADGRWIIGLNNPNNTTRQLFVFEVASGTVLRSRSLSSISNVLSVSPAGDKFMAGLSMFDTATLAVLAQQNTANSMYPFASNANFNTQQNQGGSVFSPDGGVLYSAFNIAPVQNPAASPNITQLLLSDPDNLLIRMGLQLPENLTGKMVIDSRGAAIYALSQSGFMTIPIGAMYDYPIAAVETSAVPLANDQCGVTSGQRTAEVVVRNLGKGRLTATAQVYQGTAGVTFSFPIGGQTGATTPIGGGAAGGGAGAGAPGAVIPIVLPPDPVTGVGGGQVVIPPGAVPGDARQLTQAQQTGVAANAPTVRTRRTDTETIFEFTFNANAARSLGTQTPTDFLIQANEAINIPFRVRAYQNHRNTEATGDIKVAPMSVSTAEGLVDMVGDSLRQRLHIANSGMNRVEVFDTATKQFLPPIKAGQLPRSLAMTPDGRFLYVANSGGESISIIDLNKGEVTGRVKFPPVAYNASFALNTPSVIVSTLSGVQIVMSDGSLWKVVDNEALPRKYSPVLGTSTIQAPRTMAATPGGEYAVLLGGNGVAYLFDALADDFVLSQSVATTPIQGYYGPLAAGPRGQYFVVNGSVLNLALTPLSGFPAAARPGAAVAAAGGNLIARFSQPVRSSATATVSDAPTVDLIDANTGMPRGSAAVLEGPLATQIGTRRVNVSGRTMAVDSSGSTAYVLTTAGLSIVPLSTTQPGQPGAGPASAILLNQNGVVDTASYQRPIAPGTVVAMFGQNLASAATAASVPLPTVLGGVCVTLDDRPLPLFMTSGQQINAHIPPDTKTGTRTLIVRSVDRRVASARFSINIQKYAPAVFINSATGQAAVYRTNGAPVSKSAPARRDEELVMYALGLGVTHGATVTAGNASPSAPLAETDKVQVFFGDPRMRQSEVIVEWSGLAPGMVGVYQINLRVPGFHEKGDALPVTVRIGGVDSPATGPVVPTIAVE